MRVEHRSPGAGPVFFALADETRRHIVERLHDGSNVTPSALAAELPVTRQAISKHLAILESAGLVSKTRRGRETQYRLDPQPLADAAAWIATVGSGWDDRLTRLDELLRRRGRTPRPPR